MRYFIQTVSGIAAIASLAPYVKAAAAPSSNIDYVIVGGGTAGLVLANRLTEDSTVNVLVLEAGGNGLGNQNISDINLIGAAWGTSIDWQFPSENLTFANNRNLGSSPRGKVLGGSSAINGDVWDRGDAREYNEWETLGNPGWNFNNLFTSSKKSERFFAPGASDDIEYNPAAHGTTGLVSTSYFAAAPEIHDVIISSVINAGGVESVDLANGNVNGISHVTNARLPVNSTRSTSATGYYFPFSYRPNLQVTLFATVDKIVWQSTANDNAVASGVQYIDQNGETQTVSAPKIILSAGTWGSPPILERSGVGNSTLLKSLGIQSVVDLPGVGENLQEQTLAIMTWQLNASLPFSASPFLLNMESLQTTVGSSDLSTVETLLNVQPPHLSDALFASNKRLYAQKAPWVEGYVAVATSPNGPSTLSWYPVNLHQQSRGSVHITSTNVLTSYPKIIWNLFQSPFDTYVMAAAARRIQQIIATPPLSNWIAAPISPPAGVTSIEDLGEFVKATNGIANHIIGTALMGPREDGGVVDPTLKVYGTSNVFVVDASIIPVEPGAHTQATVYALAERAADLLKAQS